MLPVAATRHGCLIDTSPAMLSWRSTIDMRSPVKKSRLNAA
jgi:hypothetical protein